MKKCKQLDDELIARPFPQGNDDIKKKWPDSAIKGSLSHASLVRLAQSLNLPFICIFEDDAYPSKNIINDLTSVLTDLPDDIDVLRLGW